MKSSKLWKASVLTLSLFLFLSIKESAAQCTECPPQNPPPKCDECPPEPPCGSCFPDTTVPLDGGTMIILAGAAILGLGKLNNLKKALN